MKQRRRRRRITIRTEEFLTVRCDVRQDAIACPVCGADIPLAPLTEVLRAGGLEQPADGELPERVPETCGHDTKD